ncbi:MAG TPA: hypothetical protein VMW25_05700 [Clostridia bacterium]|nr:hypothetical protein [Clostridia bacterium]
MKNITVITAIVIIIIIKLASPAAANMKSEDYKLQMPNLNFTAGSVSSPDYKMGFTGGELIPGEYSSAGYKLLVGFWYLKNIIPFTFTISNQVVDFGTLSSGVPATATTDLTVSAGGAGGYQVTTQENHQLMVYATGALIPDTTGDNSDISEETAGDWALDTTYGFGYTMYGDDVPTPFPTAAPAGNSYKQFADISKNEDPQVIMSSDKVAKNHTATVTYKVNISASQPAGRYHNVITYIATPTY